MEQEPVPIGLQVGRRDLAALLEPGVDLVRPLVDLGGQVGGRVDQRLQLAPQDPGQGATEGAAHRVEQLALDPEVDLGAVLAGNLTAAWLGVVESYLKEHGLPLSALAPLVEESVKKALEGGALATVSGPASRNDAVTLQRQAATLKSHSRPDQDLTLIHTLLTNRILAQHGHPPPPLQGETEGH